MSKLLVLLGLFTLLFSVSPPVNAQGQTNPNEPDRPDVSNWNLVSKSNIGVIVSDKVKYYLGFDMEYQNPNDLNERVREVRALIPFVVVKNPGKLDKNFIDTMITYVTDDAERKLLDPDIDKSDPVLFIRWRIADDLRSGTKKLVGQNEVWFWNSAGRWKYAQDINIKTSSYSETFKELGNELIIVGLKYSLNQEDYIAREIPYVFLVIAVKAEKGEK